MDVIPLEKARLAVSPHLTLRKKANKCVSLNVELFLKDMLVWIKPVPIYLLYVMSLKLVLYHFDSHALLTQQCCKITLPQAHLYPENIFSLVSH